MKMKKILLRLSCLCVLSSGTLFLRAGDLEQALVLQLRDGSRVVYFLETRPKVTFEDGRLVLSASGMEAGYPLDQVRKYTFEMADPTSVSVPGMVGTGGVQVTANGVYFTGLRVGTGVSVYTADGRKVSEVRAEADGGCRVSLQALPKGIYVIRNGVSTLKIMKK